MIKIKDIEKDYCIDFGVRSDMKLSTYLKKNGLIFMSKTLKNKIWQ